MVLLNGCLRLHNSSRFSSALLGPAAAAAAAGVSGTAAAAAAGVAHAACSNVVRQFKAPTLLAWGPELFEQLEDRCVWGKGGGGRLHCMRALHDAVVV
jgi:hypothetical protein